MASATDHHTTGLMMPRYIIRRVQFRPYRAGHTFTLTVWDRNKLSQGKWMLGYRLTMRVGRKTTVLFEGEDFGCSPCHAIDSDATMAAIMGFLTLKPGDTEREYFENYTQAQLDFCHQHAEALHAEVQARFCDENGNMR
jgi:hypothetical protein